MAARLILLLCLALFSATGQAQACAIPGEPVQWIADYCMLKLETDDEIAASDCIQAEGRRRFSDNCAVKLHFKRRMCERMIRGGTRSGSVTRCVRDPAFMGR